MAVEKVSHYKTSDKREFETKKAADGHERGLEACAYMETTLMNAGVDDEMAKEIADDTVNLFSMLKRILTGKKS